MLSCHIKENVRTGRTSITHESVISVKMQALATVHKQNDDINSDNMLIAFQLKCYVYKIYLKKKHEIVNSPIYHL